MLAYLLEHHAWYELIRLPWILLILILTYFYISRLRGHHLYPITATQISYFLIAMLLLLLVKASPLNLMGSYYLFSLHVLAVSLICFIVIPLLIISMPRDLLRRFVWNFRTRFFLTLLSHPWLSLVMFNGLLSIYLIPAVFNWLHESSLLHHSFQGLLVVSACFMWIVIIQPIREFQQLNYLLRAVYIFLASLFLMPIGFYYIIVQGAQLSVYEDVAGLLFPMITITYDQQLAGGILKLIQMFSYAYALLFMVLEWGRREEKREGKVDEQHIRYARGVVIHLHDKE